MNQEGMLEAYKVIFFFCISFNWRLQTLYQETKEREQVRPKGLQEQGSSSKKVKEAAENSEKVAEMSEGQFNICHLGAIGNIMKQMDIN